MKIKNKLFFGFIFWLNFAGLLGQELIEPFKESFENKQVISKYKDKGASEVTISDKNPYFGKHSLKWAWKGRGAFQTGFFRLLTHDQSPLPYGTYFPSSPNFVASIFSPFCQEGKIRISFLNKKNKVVKYFELSINFSGWRTIWVPFFEMEGDSIEKNERVDFSKIKISSPHESDSGILFFDDIVFSQYMDDRKPYPDKIVPFIKSHVDRSRDHWMPLIKNLERLNSLKSEDYNDKERQDLRKVEKSVERQFNKKPVKAPLLLAQREFEKLGLKSDHDSIIGPPLNYRNNQVYFNPESGLKKEAVNIWGFGKSLKKMAEAYKSTSSTEEKSKIAHLFIGATRYFLNQGWVAGASNGTREHIGYATRELTKAFFMMRKPLKRAGLLDNVGNSLKWLLNFGRILEPEKNFQANADYYKTIAPYHFLFIFLTEDIDERITLLKAFSHYLSITMSLEDEDGVFKKDGTVWHHHGHYPGYGLGAFRELPPIIKALADTEFNISAQGYANFKKALMAASYYSQLYNYGFGNAGRHPLENGNINSLRKAFLDLALAGNPEDSSLIDREVASAYLRLWNGRKSNYTKLFKDKYDIKPENLSGYKAFPYGAFAVHRRHNWAAIIKGYSKYVWSSEIYVNENRYGRYPANGSIQLLNKNGEDGSGFRQKGWDWNRYPGTTVIDLPFDELEIKDPLLMFKSKESFVGAATLGKNGVFGMKLNEEKDANSDGSYQKKGFRGKLKANKSVFSFGNKLIAIGTAVSSMDKENPVQTNLFQNYLPHKETSISIQGYGKISKFPFDAQISGKSKNGVWLLDTYNNAYHILSDSQFEVKKTEQKSFDNRYSVRTGKKNKKLKDDGRTKGNYASGWINHGKAPDNSSYAYVIYPFLKSTNIDSISKNLQSSSDFTIIRADDSIHIVNSSTEKMTGYVVFDSNVSIKDDVLKKVSVPGIIMIKNINEKKFEFNVLNPDLNVPQYRDRTKTAFSYPVKISLILNGKWELKGDNSMVQTILNKNDDTKITVETRHGLSQNFRIMKLSNNGR